MTRLKRVFIANRGEIARRVATAAQQYGIGAVSISEEAEPPGFLDGIGLELIKVAEESAALFLDGERMIQLAKDAGCDAIHPGFGFLSENAGFAEAVTAAGLTWIGPSHQAIAAMASKAKARELAAAAGVPCVPGIENIEADAAGATAATDFAETFGFPVLIKAALGGGGKGMRVVREMAELKGSLERAGSEALNSFGDASLIVERFLENPRHVEVQILGDQTGQVFAIGDRDCSIQRRHQKIIEEAPAPFIHPETRRKMQDAAIQLAKKVGYTSAGTVEYLLDGADESEEQSFYFLEMNTRLQVEHPVSEEVYGIDLVQQQFRVAEGLPLVNISSEPTGHSIEARIYAEDPADDFLPAPGAVRGFIPYSGPGVRWELGLDPIDDITGKFDPMIAKLVVRAVTRPAAIAQLQTALQQTIMCGPANNMSLLAEICSHPDFSERIQGTGFIAEHLPSLLASIKDKQQRLAPLALEIYEQQKAPRYANPLQMASRNHFAANPRWVKAVQTRQYIHPHDQSRNFEAGKVETQDGGRFVSGLWLRSNSIKAKMYSILLDGQLFSFESKDQLANFAGGQSSAEIFAPVPGKVIKLFCGKDQSIEEGQTVCVLESMKMEFEVKAQRAGQIADVFCQEGDQVDADFCLIALRDDSDGAAT